MEPSEYCRDGLRKGRCILSYQAMWVGKNALPCSKWSGYERGVMKRNEGSNERSGVKDTVAAVTNAV
ncbi:MAG: hypothetical protein JST63_11530 [Bacteroidetes bacterium]|nr:hypothetical protein [Bacteroidota bacterium]